MSENLNIAVLTHNPKGNWGDVRPLIEEQGYYNNWGKSINLKLGQIVLIYISSNIRQIQYIMEVTQVDDTTINMKLVKRLNEKQMKLLSFEKSKENGLKNGTVNYILNNNIELYKYVKDVLDENIKKVEERVNIKNIILYGAPGVGKTHNYQRLISMIENRDSEKEIFKAITDNKSSEKVEVDSDIFKNIKNEKRVEFVTFHQSYSYEDFIEGFRPNESGNIKLEDGIFKDLCTKASENKKNYYIVIDEINRGNISKIFGELITLIEEDKRDEYEITLPYSKEPFKVPSNLYIIATMNSTDKSIATVDIALRRRFTFLKMKPNLELVTDLNAKELMQKLNEFIEKKIGEDYMLGHSYFMGEGIDLEFIIEYKVKPLLEEYFYGDDEKLSDILKLIEGNND